MEIIKTPITTFDVGWKRLQIRRFNIPTSVDEASVDEGLKALQVFEKYWNVRPDGCLIATEAFRLDGVLTFLKPTVGWELCQDKIYAIHVSLRGAEIIQQHVQELPTNICVLISSYLPNENDYGVIFKDKTLQIHAIINDKTLEFLIQEKMLVSFRPLVCIHELDKKTGDINVINITFIEFHLRPVLRQKDHSYSFIQGPNPNQRNKIQKPVTDCTLLFKVKLTFVGFHETYVVHLTDIILRPYETPSFRYAMLKQEVGLDQLTALTVGNDENLIVLGKIWSRYHEQCWHAESF